MMGSGRAVSFSLISSAFFYIVAVQYWLKSIRAPERAANYEVNPPIPSLGLGTWLADTHLVAHAVEFALDSGYTHVDAASIYSWYTLISRQPSL